MIKSYLAFPPIQGPNPECTKGKRSPREIAFKLYRVTGGTYGATTLLMFCYKQGTPMGFASQFHRNFLFIAFIKAF